MFRFFTEQKIGDHFLLNDQTMHHLKVARIGREIFICVYKQTFYKCIFDQEKQMAKIIEQLNENHEFSHPVIIAISLIKIKRFEWLIQKAAELGATHLVPMISHNVNLNSDDFDKKISRWQTISQNACEQSFRNTVMQICPIQKFAEVINNDQPVFVTKRLHRFIAHEKANSSVHDSFPTNSLFLIGPEGGFTSEEVSLAKTHGFTEINLGQRILRSETAALFVLSRTKDY